MTTKKTLDRLVSEVGRSAKVRSNRIHVIARANKWIIKKDGIEKAKIFKTKAEAIIFAEEQVLSGKVDSAIIHNSDGLIENRIIPKTK